eukprot:2531123-Karenia_brevis.AAC.1
MEALKVQGLERFNRKVDFAHSLRGLRSKILLNIRGIAHGDATHRNTKAMVCPMRVPKPSN